MPTDELALSRFGGPGARMLFGAYWLLLVLATHWPNPWPDGGGPEYPDKWAHFGAYALLALLAVPVACAWAGSERRRRLALAATLVAIVGWGLFDEATQPLTGRDFEWLDWRADCLGAICGLAAGTLWLRTRVNLGVRR